MHKHTVLHFIARFLPVLMAVAALAAPTPGHAQGEVMKVNIPFEFQSGSNHFAPGVYSFHLSVATPIIRIEGDRSSTLQMTMAGSSMLSPEVSKVVFRQFGSHYILKEVWLAGRKDYVRTPKSRTEKELELAQANDNASKQGYLALLAAPQ